MSNMQQRRNSLSVVCSCDGIKKKKFFRNFQSNLLLTIINYNSVMTLTSAT